MGVLAFCWLIIEATIIPNGFSKWFYLSFYIHPSILVFCQIYLWLKLILKYIFLIFIYPYKIISFVCLYIFKFFKKLILYAFSCTRLTNNNTSSDFIQEVENLELVQNCNKNQSFSSFSNSPIVGPIFQVQDKIKFQEEEDGSVRIDDLSLIDGSSSSSYYYSDDSCEVESSISSTEDELDENLEMVNEYSPLVFRFDSPLLQEEDGEKNIDFLAPEPAPAEVEESKKSGSEDDDVDELYNKYCERMRWFDVLNYDRTCGISSILNQQEGTPSSIQSTNEAMDNLMVFPQVIWEKTSKNKILKSLDNDFELIYVAQSCLSWEALHHQYRKVESLASLTSQNGVFYNNVATEFQKFQVLLERFMEDERCEGKRVCNYVRGRFSSKDLLQVPKVSGFFEQKKEEIEAEAINVKEVLKAIERCIEAFWEFVKTDNKKSWWKFRSSLWSPPPVEDPRDLHLLADLTRKLQKKELLLKDSQGKQRCWFRKVVNPIEESQRKEMMFTMIDMKMVSRVLQLPTLSSSQLKWCQQKLDNIDFWEGKIVRASSSAPLFPP
ncbi:uncharacterized protein LOC126676602 [Mercurialis annua]|uniref:uncharacterized protein LOC126676602 n=1 Tax=Mercurialis annua TaxID=3986 RepID=UPI00215DE14B|nr:uncharacterized protein LOC126676602 [Mercurialis annua]